MTSITLIFALSAIIWYVVDRFKPIWADLTWGKYVTTAIAGALGAMVIFGYGLDLIQALGIIDHVTFIGQLLTVLTLMCGSSAISEIIARIKVD